MGDATEAHPSSAGASTGELPSPIEPVDDWPAPKPMCAKNDECATPGGSSSPCTCAEPMSCVPWSDQEGYASVRRARCLPRDPDGGKPLDPCTIDEGFGIGPDDCGPGLTCWRWTSASQAGRCVEVCRTTSPLGACPQTHGIPFSLGDANACVCLPQCDPWGSECPSGTLCRPVQFGFTCVEVHEAMPPLAPFDPCSYRSDCGPGTLCDVDEQCPPEEPRCCLPLCDVAASDCAEGFECRVHEMEYPNPYPEVGVCRSE